MDSDLFDFVIGAVVLGIVAAAYTHVIKTLRVMHIENCCRLERIEQLLKTSRRAKKEEDRAGRLRTLREVDRHLAVTEES